VKNPCRSWGLPATPAYWTWTFSTLASLGMRWNPLRPGRCTITRKTQHPSPLRPCDCTHATPWPVTRATARSDRSVPRTSPRDTMPSTPGPVPRSLMIDQSRSRAPRILWGSVTTSPPANPAIGWITVPSGCIDVTPLTAPPSPASRCPEPTAIGALVNQCPAARRTAVEATFGSSAALIAAVSVAPDWSPEGVSTVGKCPPGGSARPVTASAGWARHGPSRHGGLGEANRGAGQLCLWSVATVM